MPRQKLRGVTSFARVQEQARALYASLQSEIRSKETELRQLKEEAAAIHRLGLGSAAVGGTRGRARAARAAAAPSGRVDWRAMLDQLPKQFKAADVRGIGAAKSKRPSEIFAAITRWIDAGLVKRKARGVYERA